MVYYGQSHLPESPEFRQHQWDISSNAEKEAYIKAMVKWKEAHTFCAEVMWDTLLPEVRELILIEASKKEVEK